MSGKTRNPTIIRAERLDLLKTWLSHHLRMEILYKELRKTFNASPECHANDVVQKIFLDYTALVAEKVGDLGCHQTKFSGWLDWYLYDNGAGEKGFEAKASNWKTSKRIKSLEDLLDLIENKPNNK